MDKFDEKVIGYESTKEILRQILDILKRPEVYKRKGISIPRGLLMESDPGLGKSLLASILMEESERKPFVFRKTSQENSFLDELRAVFAMAKEEAPSILLLEDLNLYVESTSPYAPEWACLQACIDDAKDTDLFVIATTNDTRYMPPSLLRPGRFDYVIYLQPPIGENAENIVSYYLRDKDLAEDVLISDIVKAMPKVSCATLETVMNLAALNSVYQGHEHIQKEDITEALLQVVYKLQKTDKETDSTELQKIAVHEAAHAVVGEVLHPGSIGIVTVRGSQGVIGGMANGCATYAQNEEEFLDEVTKTLAGRAGVSLIYGVMDIQASADIEQADMNDNEENTSDKIIVATKFDGSLCEERLQVNDSPGVNLNGAPEHKEITERMLQEQNYDLLIYIMNATQLGTTDEATHLKRVQQLAGKIPILFVINKMDAVNAEEENVLALLQEQWAFLQENGFVHPAICPVSSKAAFLAKRFAAGNLSRSEERELYCSVDKFEK